MHEVYYPRGGTRPKTGTSKTVKTKNLFNTLKVEKKKRKRSNTKPSNASEITNLHLTCAELLAYDKILPGMVLLGCIRNISSYTIEVELPGRTFAKIEINAISDYLSNYLLAKAEAADDADVFENVLQTLSKIFTVTQFIPVFVLDIVQNQNKSKYVKGCLNPKHINAHLKYGVFTKGMLVWGSIVERSDYVYIVDLGAKNTRAVLPFKYCDDKTYVEGEPSWFIVRESRISDGTATITLDANKEDISNSIMDVGHIDEVLPGTCVNFIITKVLRDGVEGVYFGEYTGYINQIYFNNPMDSPQRYENHVIRAYVLYVHPVTKFAFLSTRNVHQPLEAPSLRTGHIAPVKITQTVGKGVIVQFKKYEFGIVTHKRLIKSLKSRDSSELSDLVRAKFPIGSTHNCRILDYINIDRMYVCTFEQHELQEELFTKHDLKLGQLVKGIVDGINASGVTVKIGKLVGFATNEHLSNVRYTENLKRIYHIGDCVKARVWDINGNSIKLSLKQSFIEEDKCLTSYEMAKRNEEYKGMVVKTYSKGALICFYGGVKGWLKLKDSKRDHENMFYQGQVINVIISFCDGNKMFLTLNRPGIVSQKKLQMGQFTSGIVESIDSTGIHVRTSSGGVDAFLPVNHLSVNRSLSSTMLNLFSLGDNIDHLVCIDQNKGKTLSRREYSYYKNDKNEIIKRNQLTPGLMLRCSVELYDKEKLLLTSPILSFKDYITVNKEDILDDGKLFEELDFAEGQSVVAKLTTVTDREVKATVKLSDVHDKNYKCSVDLLEKYLGEVQFIQHRLAANGDPLAQYKIGQRVTCEIQKICNMGCSVSLPDGVQGIVAPEHWPNKPLANSRHEGVVLYINFVNKCLEISLNAPTNQKISKTQGNTNGVSLGQTIYAKLLLIRPEFILCSLGPPGNKQISYMPTILHENDFQHDYDYYRTLTGAFKFIVVAISNGNIIGLEKNYKQNLEKANKLASAVTKKRRKTDQGNGYVKKQSKRIRLASSGEGIPDWDNEVKLERELQNERIDNIVSGQSDEIQPSSVELLTENLPTGSKTAKNSDNSRQNLQNKKAKSDQLEPTSVAGSTEAMESDTEENGDDIPERSDGYVSTNTGSSLQNKKASSDQLEPISIETSTDEMESDTEENDDDIPKMSNGYVSTNTGSNFQNKNAKSDELEQFCVETSTDEMESDSDENDDDMPETSNVYSNTNTGTTLRNNKGKSDQLKPTSPEASTEDESDSEESADEMSEICNGDVNANTGQEMEGESEEFESDDADVSDDDNEENGALEINSTDSEEEEGDNSALINVEINQDSAGSSSDKKRVSFNEIVQRRLVLLNKTNDDTKFVSPSMTRFFDSDDEDELKESSDEEADENETKPKKKRLTRTEQVEILRQQEEELRKKELEFADPKGTPESAEQFDRRLLAEPNASEIWTQYITFHLASTEIDKARAVIKRALQSIDLKADQERLNVWIAWLNLESYYGTKESFTKVFDDAVRCNDDFTIYMHAIKIKSSSDVNTQDEYIRKACAKFKQNPKMYIEIGRILYVQNRLNEARKLKDNALRTITNTGEHVPLIVQFAGMEFTYGEDNMAEALFETILQSSPKRVDVWCAYVDQLVKKNKIDIARRVLERAVTQQLHFKKMKTLHKKFYHFEEKYGNEESRAHQQKMLADYTKRFGNLQE